MNSRQEAILLIGSVNLPGGAQRRRTLEDRLQMRQLFCENDVISCEVASFYRDGGMSVQTRNLKYGKLENGRLVVIPQSLLGACKHHFVSLRCGVDVVLGNNGYLWLTASELKKRKFEDEDVEMDDEGNAKAGVTTIDVEQAREIHEMEKMRANHASRVIAPDERARIARVANVIAVLVESKMMVTPKAIETMYEASVSASPRPSDILIPANVTKIVEETKFRLSATKGSS